MVGTVGCEGAVPIPGAAPDGRCAALSDVPCDADLPEGRVLTAGEGDPVECVVVPPLDCMRARLALWWRDFLHFWVNSLPHVTGAVPWILGVRSALVFLIPLALGALTGYTATFLPIAISGGALAMADPGGSFDKRGLTLLVTGLLCAGLYEVAGLCGAAGSVATTVFIALAVYLVGFTPEFANPGIRGGFLAVSVALIGTSQHHSMLSMFDAWAFLYATPVCILLSSRLRASGMGREAAFQNLEFSWRLRVFAHHLPQHLLCRTAVARHAMRMSVSAFMAVNFSQLVGFQHPEWAAIASVILLHPTAPTFRQRGAALFTGTFLGCALAALLIVLTGSHAVALALVVVSLVFAAPFRHVDYAAYVTMYSVFFIGALSLTSNDIASDLSVTRVYDTVLGLLCSLLVLRFSMTDVERAALMEEIEFAAQPQGRFAVAPEDSALRERMLEAELEEADNMSVEEAAAAAERIEESGDARYRA